MKDPMDLGELKWKVFGLKPEQWRASGPTDKNPTHSYDVSAINATVPGSAQQALLNAGLIPDWNIGLNTRLCEWAENRQWFFETAFRLPRKPDDDERIVLKCMGLDYSGRVFLNGAVVGEFANAFTPHEFDLTDLLSADEENALVIGFDLPPRWMGMYGHTSLWREWKPRFYYTWDWVSRFVQTGIYGAVTLEHRKSPRVEWLDVTADFDSANGRGSMRVAARFDGDADVLDARIRLDIPDGGLIGEWSRSSQQLREGVLLEDLAVLPWQPNGMGAQPLYTLSVRVTDGGNGAIFEGRRRLGFRRVEWRKCEGASQDADPWICAVNGNPIYLQGANWVPVRPNFADVKDEDIRSHVALYRDMGANVLRAWAGAPMERDAFFDACDEMGIFVWQEFPLTSSCIENMPPSDPDCIAAMRGIVRSYIERGKHRASILLWCGGNELLDVNEKGHNIPCDRNHPMLSAMKEIVVEMDPERRFVPSSPSGPIFVPSLETAGKGLHWDTHGPWRCDEPSDAPEGWLKLWREDDSLFHSECGAPGASPVDLIERYRGDLPAMPADGANPLWSRTSWWIEWDTFIAEKSREPASLEEYVAWSQQRQAALLGAAARICKSKFPRCGGMILWMGHDCYPCAANTSVIDFEGVPKPAWHALREVFMSKPEDLAEG